VLQVVLVFGPGFPEGAGLADLGHDLAVPQARGVGVGDRVLGDPALLVARVEDLGTVVGTDQFLAEVGPVDLEEELEDGPVGGPRGIEGDFDRLGMTRMVVGGGVVVLSAGVADAGGDDSVAVPQQFLRGPETAPGQDRGLGLLAHRGPHLLNLGQRLGRRRLRPAGFIA
jgi:hypothetical protein